MRLSGFADEAANGIDGQIAITKMLGWPCIEARSIDGRNIHDIPDDAFEDACRKLGDAGMVRRQVAHRIGGPCIAGQEKRLATAPAKIDLSKLATGAWRR